MNSAPDKVTIDRLRLNELSDLEQIVVGYREALEEIAQALYKIKEHKLYELRGFDSFKSYCDQHLKLSRSYAYRLADYGEDIIQSVANGDTPPSNEHQSRKARKSKRDGAANGDTSEQPAPTPPTKDSEFLEATGVSTFDQANEIVAGTRNPDRHEYMRRLEGVVRDAIENATDAQLESVAIYAATISKLVKQVLQERKETKLC